MAEHSKDLSSYLKYCNEVVYAGNEASAVSEEFEEFYRAGLDGPQLASGKSEPQDCEMMNHQTPDGERKPASDPHGAASSSSAESTSSGKRSQGNEYGNLEACKCESCSRLSLGIRSLKSIALERLKFEMAEVGFRFLPPRTNTKTHGYFHYSHMKEGLSLIPSVHADYYILLRAFASVVQVDIQIVHSSVLNLENRLNWTEQRIRQTIQSFKKKPPKSE